MTAVRRLLRKVSRQHLPHGWVGDLPYLLSLKEWRIIRVTKLKPGDLIFRGKKKGVLSHIGMVITSDLVFHCTWKRNSVIESVDQFFKMDCSQKQSPNAFVTYRDMRR